MSIGIQSNGDIRVAKELLNSLGVDSGSDQCSGIAVAQIMEECSGYPNFLISSGCDIPPMTPWENIDAFFSAVNKMYQ